MGLRASKHRGQHRRLDRRSYQGDLLLQIRTGLLIRRVHFWAEQTYGEKESPLIVMGLDAIRGTIGLCRHSCVRDVYERRKMKAKQTVLVFS
jgi:hypothetical protein